MRSVVAFRSAGSVWELCVAAVLLVAAARVVAVGPTLIRLIGVKELSPRKAPLVVWGGLRGGISVALALSIPASPYRPLILICTCAQVIFSVLVQDERSRGWRSSARDPAPHDG